MTMISNFKKIPAEALSHYQISLNNTSIPASRTSSLFRAGKAIRLKFSVPPALSRTGFSGYE